MIGELRIGDRFMEKDEKLVSERIFLGKKSTYNQPSIFMHSTSSDSNNYRVVPEKIVSALNT